MQVAVVSLPGEFPGRGVGKGEKPEELCAGRAHSTEHQGRESCTGDVTDLQSSGPESSAKC